MSYRVDSNPRALILGVSGQDGSYLAQLLVSKHYKVYGTSRTLSDGNFGGLRTLSVDSDIKLMKMDPVNFNEVFEVIKAVMPQEIYNLSGQSSVALSFKQPLEAFQSNAVAAMNILNAIRMISDDIRFYNAGSGEVFGDTYGVPAKENSAFNPVSPYGLAKAQATISVKLFREVYGLYACTGILFNHESPLRPSSYVTQKIINSAIRISKGSDENLSLGNMDISRDWGYAPEYVDAMWRMLQLETPEDFVIATGKTTCLKGFTETVFKYFDLDWKNHVVINKALLRRSDIKIGAACPDKAFEKLGWKAKLSIPELVAVMIEANYEHT